MGRHSILAKLNLLFVIVLLAVIVATTSMTLHMLRSDTANILFKSRLIINEVRRTQEVPHSLLAEFHLKEVQGAQKNEVIKNGRSIKKFRKILRRELHPLGKMSANDDRLIAYKGYRYLLLRPTKDKTILLEDGESFFSRFATPLWVFLGVASLLLSMYVLLRRSLMPLKKLKDDIRKYGDGTSPAYRHTCKKDEVSLVANAFYDSAEKLQNLQASRELFVRNIFHELNTPVTKGKILAEIVEEPKAKAMLDSIFTRFSVLLKELAKIEQISSNNYAINPKLVSIRELLDEAKGLLYLDNQIKTNVTSETMMVDFSSMSIVFKNLIDNAQKYGSNTQVVVDENNVHFISEGALLSEKFGYYTQAFTKVEDSNANKGFGLGLYIVSEVVKKHGMRLEYSHKDNRNYFTIVYGNLL